MLALRTTILPPGALDSILKQAGLKPPAGGSQMQRYPIVLAPTVSGFSAYSPDLAGCVATGATRAEVEANMREAIALHLEGLREDGEPVPSGQSIATHVDAAA